MEKERTFKIVSIFILLLLVLGITVAFAVMSERLQINGTATIDPAKWEIIFEDLKLAGKSDDVSVDEAPDIVENTTIEDYKVTLTKPGDTISYTFDVANNGSLDAELTSLLKEEVPTFTGIAGNADDKLSDEQIVRSNFTYALTYTNSGDTVEEGTILPQGEKVNMTLTLSYNGNELPTDDVAISDLGITLVYTQI